MTLSIKKITLWRGKIPHRPGALSEVLEPLAAGRANLEILMGYREPGDTMNAVVELWPVSGRKITEAVGGVGLGHTIARALSESGINLAFLVAQVVGRQYSAVFGFENDADAARAVKLIRGAAVQRKTAKRASAR
jgi:hypothetical protein